MSRIFKNFSISFFIFFIFFISGIGFAGGDDISVLQEELDMILTDEYNPCFDQLEGDISDDSNITSVIQLSGIGSFSQDDEIMSSSNVKAIVESYDSITNQITYYQTAKTGFKSFSIGDKLVGKGLDVLTIEEFVLDFVVPCSDLVVSIEEDPEQMIFIFADSEAARQAKLAAQEMMAEIETEMARQAALKAFQEKLEAERAAAARSTAIYQARLQQEQMIKDRQAQLALERELAAFEAELEAELAAAADQLAIEKELAAFEARLEAELVAQEMMAEIETEMARQAALKAFQEKLEAERAAAAAATAAYRASLEEEVIGELVVEDEVIVVTEAAHEACKHALGLTEANITLFENALADGTLFNKGPQSANGTEFGASRWDAYANCVSNYVNPF
jgi:colicin import membrane protein